MSNTKSFPDCIKNALPEAASTISGNLTGYVLSGEKCQVVFWEVKKGFSVDAHSHDHAEWGIVIHGSCEVCIDGKYTTYNAGQEFYINPGESHSAKMSDDYKALDFFHSPDWIKIKQ